MQVSHVISDSVLALVCLFVFFRFFGYVPFYNKILWGLFLITVALTATMGMFRFAGMDYLKPLHSSLGLLAGTVGLTCAIVAIYGLVLQQSLGRTALIAATTVGIVLFVLLLNPAFRPFDKVVASLAMLVSMIVAVFGLLRRYKKALWIVIGVMILGISTKITPQQIPLHPVDLYHYALSGMILCFGKAV